MSFGDKDFQSYSALLIHRGACYLHDLTLLMLILITRFVCQVLPLNSYSFPLFHPVVSLWEEVTLCSPHLRSGEFCSPIVQF